ncbi:hypothetical protein BH11PAT2_BH11PAT2_05800 [soil metagenome]
MATKGHDQVTMVEVAPVSAINSSSGKMMTAASYSGRDRAQQISFTATSRQVSDLAVMTDDDLFDARTGLYVSRSDQPVELDAAVMYQPVLGLDNPDTHVFNASTAGAAIVHGSTSLAT